MSAIKWTILKLYVPAETKIEAEQLEQLLTILWGKLARRRWSWTRQRLAFEIRATKDGVAYHWAVPVEEAKYLETMVTEAIPGVSMEPVAEYFQPVPAGRALATCRMEPTKSAAYALADFTPDFGAKLRRVLDEYRKYGDMTVQVLMQPMLDGAWHSQGKQDLALAEGKRRRGAGAVEFMMTVINSFVPGWETEAAARPVVTRADRLATKETPKKLLGHGYAVRIRLAATAEEETGALALVERMAGVFTLLERANHLRPRKRTGARALRLWERMSKRVKDYRPYGLILSPEEATSLIYPVPVEPRDEQGVRLIELRQPPAAEGLYLCDGLYRGKRVQVRIPTQDLDQHIGIFGETGTGKGVLLENVFREAARLGIGGLYIDPKGNSVKKILASMPEQHMEQIVYIEAGHPRRAVPINMLRPMPGADANSVARMAVDLFHKLWESGWGFSTQEHLTAVSRAAVDMGATLVEAELLLADSGFRDRNLHRVQNPSIRAHLGNLPEKLSESVRPPLNKLHEILWTDELLAMVGQEDTLDWQQLIRQRKIILVNCNKDLPAIGTLGARLVGAVIWSLVSTAAGAVGRSQQFIMVADELADVVQRSADDFKDGLIQRRQDRKPMIGAGQYPSQLPDAVYDALKGTGGKVLLRQDSERSDTSRKYLGADRILGPDELANLPNLVGFANLLVNGQKTGLFTCWAPPFSQELRDPAEAAEKLLAKYGRPYGEVLAQINKRHAAATGATGPRRLE